MGLLHGTIGANKNQIISQSWQGTSGAHSFANIKGGDFIDSRPDFGSQHPSTGFALNPGNYWVNHVGPDDITYFRMGAMREGAPYIFYDDYYRGLVISGSGLAIESWGTANGGYSSRIFFSGSHVTLETPAFFMGATGSAYISGSEGNLSISSSNFFLAPAGDVTMQGTVTADAGKIGDWVITGSNMESDTDYYRGIKLKPSDKIVGYGNTAHRTQTISGSFSFGVAPIPPGGGGNNWPEPGED